jgi:hypothetical protein
MSGTARHTFNVVHPSATVGLTWLIAPDLRQCVNPWPLIPVDTDPAECRDDEDGRGLVGSHSARKDENRMKSCSLRMKSAGTGSRAPMDGVKAGVVLTYCIAVCLTRASCRSGVRRQRVSTPHRRAAPPHQPTSAGVAWQELPPSPFPEVSGSHSSPGALEPVHASSACTIKGRASTHPRCQTSPKTLTGA